MIHSLAKWLQLALAAGLLAGCAAPGPVALADGAFCYRTIGHPECHRAALPGEERRLITVGPKYP